MPNCWLWQQRKVLELSVYKPWWFIKISTTENKPTFLTISLIFSLFLCLSVCLSVCLFVLPVIHYARLLEFSTCSFKLLCHQVFVSPDLGRAFTGSKYTKVSLHGLVPYKIATYVSKISLEWQYFRPSSGIVSEHTWNVAPYLYRQPYQLGY